MLTILLSTFSVYAKTEIVCATGTTGSKKQINFANYRIIQRKINKLEKDGNEVEITNITSSTGGASDGSIDTIRFVLINQICVSIRY